MKLITIPSLLFLFSTGALYAQTTAYTLLLPVYTDAGEYSGDYDIGRASITIDGRITAGALKPEMVSTLAVREYTPEGIPDGAGGMYLAYTIEHVDSANAGDTDLLIRRIDAKGKDIWSDTTDNPVRFVAESSHLERAPHLIATSDGVIVVYEIEYRDGQYAGDVDLAAMRFTGDGEPAWEEPVWVANTERRESIAGSFPSKNRTGILFLRSASADLSGPSDIFATSISEDGTIGWNRTNREVPIGASAHSERNPSISTDGDGGAYIAYEIGYLSGQKSGDVDIIAQHLTSDGDRRWIDPERPPFVATSGSAMEVNPVLEVDSTGVTVVYEMYSGTSRRDSVTNTYVGAQRLDLEGRAIWNDGLRSTIVPVLNRLGRNPRITGDGFGGSYVVFDGLDTITGDIDVFAQRISPEGTLSWNKHYALPVFFGPMPETTIAALPDSHGGVIVIAAESDDYRIKREGPRDTTFIAQRLDANGLHSWELGEHNLLITRSKMGDHPAVVVSGN